MLTVRLDLNIYEGSDNTELEVSTYDDSRKGTTWRLDGQFDFGSGSQQVLSEALTHWEALAEAAMRSTGVQLELGF